MHHRASIARRSSSFDAPFCTHCVESPQGFSPFAARVVAPRRPVPPRLFRVVALSFTTVRAFALIAALILRSNPVVVVVVVSPRSARSRRTSRASAGPRASSRRLARPRRVGVVPRASRVARRVARRTHRARRPGLDLDVRARRDAAGGRGSRIEDKKKSARDAHKARTIRHEGRNA